MTTAVNGDGLYGRHRGAVYMDDSDDDSDSITFDHKDGPAGTSLEATPVSKAITKDITHRVTTRGSILALAVNKLDDCLIAGLQGGDIVAWSLDTYELILGIHAHADSVQALYLSEDGSLLFSCGSDSLVNIWSTQSFDRVCSIHSHYDVGDLYSMVFSSPLNVIFCGSQAQSIQWHTLDLENMSTTSTTTLATRKKHKFFDSLGPGGTASPTPSTNGVSGYLEAKGGRVLGFGKCDHRQYAHDSYIYCMLLVKGLIPHDYSQEVLITGGGDGQIKLWNIHTLGADGLSELHCFKNRGTGVLSMAHSGTFLYAGMLHGAVHIYNLDSQQLVQKVDLACGQISAIQVIRGIVFCGTSEGYVKQFNSHFTEASSWHSNGGKILASAITNTNGKDIYITGGNDDTVAFWDVTHNSEASSDLLLYGNDELVHSLRDFVAFKTVSANAKYAGECNEAAIFLRKLFNLFGAKTVLLSTEHGVNPIILAKFEASLQSLATQTILFYGHYDVVDAEYNPDDEIWLAHPFQLHPVNGYLYGRGVTDNKGPILAALYAVAELVQTGGLKCNVVFLIEGEEEVGSRGLVKTVQRHREHIGDVDFILLANSYWLDDHIPCLTYGMRGVVHATLGVFSNHPDRHSGMDGKATVHEPLKDLTTILGALVGPSGTGINIPGFYDTVSEPDSMETRRYAAITSTLMPGHPEIKDARAFAESLQRRWREPNLTVHRIDVPKSKTAVTISRSATANLSIRIVPGQDADQIAEDLCAFAKNTFAGLRSTNWMEMQITSKANAWLGDLSNEIFQTLDAAITEVWSADADLTSSRSFPPPTVSRSPAAGSESHKSAPYRRASSLASTGSFTLMDTPRKPLYIREGGSIPAISFLEKEFRAPAAMFPCGQASDNAHLDNERMRVENLYNAREVFKKIFGRLPARAMKTEDF